MPLQRAQVKKNVIQAGRKYKCMQYKLAEIKMKNMDYKT